MHQIIIKKNDDNVFLFFLKDEFIGKMDSTQMFLFYITYKIKTSDNKEAIEKYYEVLNLLSNSSENSVQSIVEKLNDKFSFLIKFNNIDLGNINIINLFENTKEKIFIDRVKNFVPKKIVISLTNKCFCKCNYCYSKKATDICPNSELKFSTIKTILQYVFFWGISEIDLTGGDPLAYTNFFDVLEICKNYNIKVNLSTKKVLSDSEINNLMLYSEQISSFQMSIDSIYEDEQLKLVNVNYTHDILNSLKKLIDKCANKFEIKVNSVLTKYNIDNILELSTILFGMGNIKHGLSPYTLNLSSNNTEFFPSVEQYDNLRKKIEHFENKQKLIYPISLFNNFSDFNTVICKAGIDGLVINNDGNVYVCERLCSNEQFSLGNVYVNTLYDIWNSDRLFDFSFPNKNLFKNSKCYNCDYFDKCVRERGLCFVNSYIINKTIYSPDNFCKYTDIINTFRIY